MTRKKKYRASTHIGVEREMIHSRAWYKLNSMGKNIVLELMTRVRKREHGTKAGEWIQLNNGELELSYKWLEKNYGASRPKIKRGFDDAVRKGFLKITQCGGGYTGRPNKYALVDEWRNYDDPGWVEPAVESRIFEAGRLGLLRMHKRRGHKLRKCPLNEPITMELTHKLTANGSKPIEKVKTDNHIPIVSPDKIKAPAAIIPTNDQNGQGKWSSFGKAFDQIKDPDLRQKIGKAFLEDRVEDFGVETKIENRELLVRLDTIPTICEVVN